MERILILGGGASGLAAAISAAETAPRGVKVTLLEANPRVGKKLLATGNGRCNLDNTAAALERYVTSEPQVLSQMLGTMSNPLDWFHSHGLLTRADSEGRVYPYSNQAADVLNLLLRWLEQLNVEVLTGQRVTGLTPKDGGFAVTTETDRFFARSVICALGGQAGPQFGTSGSGSALAKGLGFRVLPEYPCLVGLQCDKPRPAGLAGIRVKATVTLTDGGTFIAREEGEVQFTEQGLSGIVIMQLSNFLKPKGGLRRPILHMDLFPAYGRDSLTDLFQHRVRLLYGADGTDFMTGLVHKRIGAAVWKAAGLGEMSRKVSSLSAAELAALAGTFGDWQFGDLTSLGWQQAQTTGGGMALSQLDGESFMAADVPGLYFVGETLDAAGSCGGFNLHWAFGSGITAGRHAAARLSQPQKSSPHRPKQRREQK